MKRYCQHQKYIMIALLVAVVGLAIGFATFSATLNVSSSTIVTPNSSNFNIVYSSSELTVNTTDNAGIVVNGVGTNGAQGGILNLYRKQAAGLTAQFTEPGQSLSTTIYAHNIGEYDAYLTGVNITNINGNSYKKCTGQTGATDSLVQDACDGIVIYVTVGDDAYDLSNNNISKHVMPKGSVEPIIITITYNSSAARADGNFDIEFGDLSLEYSTVDRSNLFKFSVNGKEYYAEKGMTFGEWLQSDYNIDGSWSEGWCICFSASEGYSLIETDDTLIEEKTYQTNGENCPF